MRLKFWKREKKKERVISNALYMGSTNANNYTSTVTIPDQRKITKGQCIGFKKSGERCSRIVDTVYCYQHNKRS